VKAFGLDTGFEAAGGSRNLERPFLRQFASGSRSKPDPGRR
jgi:hypothetical protein